MFVGVSCLYVQYTWVCQHMLLNTRASTVALLMKFRWLPTWFELMYMLPYGAHVSRDMFGRPGVSRCLDVYQIDIHPRIYRAPAVVGWVLW